MDVFVWYVKYWYLTDNNYQRVVLKVYAQICDGHSYATTNHPMVVQIATVMGISPYFYL